MKKILIASAASLAFAGAAFAQQAPFIAGDYSANVEQNYNKVEADTGMNSEIELPDLGIDFGTTASVDSSADTEVVSPGDVNTANPQDNLGR
jgi:hypothetical protein